MGKSKLRMTAKPGHIYPPAVALALAPPAKAVRGQQMATTPMPICKAANLAVPY